MKKAKNEAFFTVSLDGLNLTDDQIGRIDKGIKEVVAREVAQIDHRGDLVINDRLDLNPRFKGFKFPILFGIWIENWDVFRKRQIDGFNG